MEMEMAVGGGETEAETATETGKRKDEPNRQTDKQTQRGGRTES